MKDLMHTKGKLQWLVSSNHTSFPRTHSPHHWQEAPPTFPASCTTALPLQVLCSAAARLCEHPSSSWLSLRGHPHLILQQVLQCSCPTARTTVILSCCTWLGWNQARTVMSSLIKAPIHRASIRAWKFSAGTAISFLAAKINP